MSKKYVVANWKMLPTSWAEAEQILDFVNDHLQQSSDVPFRSQTKEGALAKEENGLSLVFCPPFIFLEEVGKVLKTSHFEHGASLGAQDMFWDDVGADTGEVSGPMLNKMGVRYVIVGHSERRWKLGESDEVVNKKLKAVLRNEMTPIVCLGEKIRDDSFGEFLREQAEKTFAGLSQDEMRKCIIAYEPVWAISTNPDARPDTPESAMESIRIIQNFLIENWKFEIEDLPKILYGGSVTSKNVVDFIEKKEIDGVLVGGASVNKEEFVKMLSLVK